MNSLLTALIVWVPIVFAVMVIVVGVLLLTVVLPPARAKVREQRLRDEIERRAAGMGGPAMGGADPDAAADDPENPERPAPGDAH